MTVYDGREDELPARQFKTPPRQDSFPGENHETIDDLSCSFGHRFPLWLRWIATSSISISTPFRNQSRNTASVHHCTQLVFQCDFSVSGKPPLAIAGSIGQNGSSISGALHVEGSSCFDQQTIDMG